jgi:hypothetical protein
MIYASWSSRWFCWEIKQFLDSHFPDRWKARRWSVLWPPRSPVLTSVDFYLWSHLKATVYSKESTRETSFGVWFKRLRQQYGIFVELHSAPGYLGVTGLGYALKLKDIFSNVCEHSVNIKTLLCWNVINKWAPYDTLLASFDFIVFPVLDN